MNQVYCFISANTCNMFAYDAMSSFIIKFMFLRNSGWIFNCSNQHPIHDLPTHYTRMIRWFQFSSELSFIRIERQAVVQSSTHRLGQSVSSCGRRVTRWLGSFHTFSGACSSKFLINEDFGTSIMLTVYEYIAQRMKITR